MKIKSLLCIAFICTFTLCILSCSDDDEPGDPAGTITINMLNEDNGKTELGNSDVYIDNANNFYGPSCQLSSLGKKDGLGGISTPVIKGISQKIAVEPGNAYQVFRDAAIKVFPSGNLALNILADYYNVYVVSPISQEDKTMGTVIKYVLADVPTYDLPEYNENIGTIDPYDYLNQELTYNLPTTDFEYEFDGGYNQFDIEKEGKQLIIKLTDFKARDNFNFYIRIKNSYTYIWGSVE